MGNKERLFEMMGKLDPNFKPKLNENVFNDAGEPNMTHSQARDYTEPSEPEYDDNAPERPQSGNDVIKAIEKSFDTILETYDGKEYYFLTKNLKNTPLEIYINGANIDATAGNNEFGERDIDEFDVNELIQFFEPYRQYIKAGEEAERAMDNISAQNNADRMYGNQERGMMGGY